MKTIEVKCKGSLNLGIEELNPFQGDLKDLNKDNYKRLRGQILKEGFCEPFSVWMDPEDNKWKVLNGHQRLRVLQEMKLAEKYVIPELPVSVVDAKSKAEAKRKILTLASQYGTMSSQGLYNFIVENNITMESLDMTHFPEINLEDFKAEFFENILPDDQDKDDLYSKKVEIPIYSPKGEKPSLKELYDTTKVEALIKGIEAAKVPEELRLFLVAAAIRHTVFNFENIAEYYAHASKEVQDLMEKSALVIIDFHKAIEEGFLVMTKELAEASNDK